MASEPRLQRIAGTAEREVVRRGTASEHEATVVTTKKGERLILQRIGGNPFSDEDTRQLAGQRVSLRGVRLGDVFRYEAIGAAEKPEKAPPRAARPR